MTATALVGEWWWWPFLLLASWAATPAWRWTWLLTLQLSVVGFEWAYVGATSLGTWSDRLFLVGFAWAGFPARSPGSGASVKGSYPDLHGLLRTG
jgi:hypothetical protein